MYFHVIFFSFNQWAINSALVFLALRLDERSNMNNKPGLHVLCLRRCFYEEKPNCRSRGSVVRPLSARLFSGSAAGA